MVQPKLTSEDRKALKKAIKENISALSSQNADTLERRQAIRVELLFLEDFLKRLA